MPRPFHPNIEYAITHQVTTLDLSRYNNRRVPWQDQLNDESVDALLEACPRLSQVEVDSLDLPVVGYLARFPYLISIETARLDAECSLTPLKSLTELILAEAELDDDVLARIAELKGLKSLCIYFSEFDCESPFKHFKCLTNLESLIIKDNDMYSIADSHLHCIRNLLALKELELDLRWEVSDKGVEYFSCYQQLRKLTLHNCSKLTDKGFLVFAELGLLEELILERAENFTDVSLKAISRLPNIERLIIRHARTLSSLGTQCLSNLARLRHLELSWCHLRKWEFLCECSDLESLALEGNFSERGLFFALPRFRQSLIRLSLRYSGEAVTDEALSALIGFSRLKELDMGYCNDLSGTGFNHLESSNLKTLNLASCKKLTDEGVRVISGIKSLKNLDLSECDLLTNQSIHYLASLPKLERLNLCRCLNITDEGVDALTRLSTLKALDVALNPVYNNCLRRVQAANPDCKIAGWKRKDERPAYLAGK